MHGNIILGRNPILRFLTSSLSILLAILLATPAQAAFHLWNLREIYTDSSGSLQFIELFCPISSQQFVGGQQISVRNAGNTITHTFTIPSDLPGNTANKAFLLGTSGIDPSGGPAPDFIIPNNFLFAEGGTISFFGANGGSYIALPTDGVNSRTWGGGNAINSPQNFAGQSGVVVVPEPSVGFLIASGLVAFGLFRRRQR